MIKIARSIFYYLVTVTLLAFFGGYVMTQKKPNYPNRIYSYLRKCTTEVSVRFYASEPEKDIYTCDDRRVDTTRTDRNYYFNSGFEISSSEILWSKDGQKFVVNVSSRVKQDFFWFLWDKPIWTSFNGEKIVNGKSALP